MVLANTKSFVDKKPLLRLTTALVDQTEFCMVITLRSLGIEATDCVVSFSKVPLEPYYLVSCSFYVNSEKYKYEYYNMVSALDLCIMPFDDYFTNDLLLKTGLERDEVKAKTFFEQDLAEARR